MSRAHAHNARNDANEREIIRVLEAPKPVAPVVTRLKKPADLVVAYGRKFVIVEVKRPLAEAGSKSDIRFTEPEREYYRAVCELAPYAVIQTPLQAANLLRYMSLSDEECFAWCLERTREWAHQAGDPVLASIPRKVPAMGKFGLTRSAFVDQDAASTGFDLSTTNEQGDE